MIPAWVCMYVSSNPVAVSLPGGLQRCYVLVIRHDCSNLFFIKCVGFPPFHNKPEGPAITAQQELSEIGIFRTFQNRWDTADLRPRILRFFLKSYFRTHQGQPKTMPKIGQVEVKDTYHLTITVH